ncbi:peptide chain release factor N(5)-glutamine methyltransferase [Fundidesulfovibrio soli]|uniref:peptide chain release factor N(5)-glutamine methyltransferase n=1 Tax=Fundidesulfovibrio soli TaxID=2922716 RepID=UPI001FAEE03A|nr:peptide chain release factor N(5)-glutamine methyltransferase [Fundidesulfovibrio soli]
MSRQPTLRDILAKTENYFREKNVDSPRLSAQLILGKGLGVDRMGLFLNLDRPMLPAELDALRPLVARRGRGEPVAYITGEREFFSMAFAVDSNVLIPRPETEQIVEEALRAFPRETELVFADLGCGSGCLAVTLAAQFTASRGVALDVSPGALAVARANAARHNVEGRLEFVQGTFADLPAQPCGYTLVVSNPPYVSEAEYGELSPEVAAFEPRGALVPDTGAPGANGLEAYPEVARVARERLAPGGVLILEIGWKQGQAVKELLESQEFGFEGVGVLKDLAGLDRVVIGRRPC